MKRFLILVASLAPCLCAGQNAQQSYIEQYAPLAVAEMQRTGVPASITLAQALLESGAGRSDLAILAHNHFGLKCHEEWKGETFYKDDDTAQECFRAYASDEESYRAHSDFLRSRERYRSLFELDPTDYKAWSRGLRQAGYATDRRYADKLIGFIEDFQLYRYDEEALAQAAPVPAVAAPAATGTAQAAPAAQRRIPAAVESLTLPMSRKVLERNGVPYVLSVEGDTYSSLATAYHLFPREILRYNDLAYEPELEPDTIVYLGRKKKQAANGTPHYEVKQNGLTLWDISQMFGVQLKKIRLYNSYRGDGPALPGETILLRKP